MIAASGTRRRATVAAALLLFVASAACRNLQIEERWREPRWSFARRLQNIVILEPQVAPTAHESPLLYLVLPLSYAAQLLTIRLPQRAQDASELVSELRATIASHMESGGLHAIDLKDVDEAYQNHWPMVQVGGDYLLHTRIVKWERGYIVLGSWVRVVIESQLVRLSDGAVVWDGTVESTRQAGLLQLGSQLYSLTFSAPVAGAPVGQVSALTGPLARLRGGAYREIVRDIARLLSLHLAPAPIELCPCTLCADARAGQLAKLEAHGGALPVPGGSPVLQAVVAGGTVAPFVPGDVIEVIAVAPEDAIVSFDVGSLKTNIPMVAQGRVVRPEQEGLALFRGRYVVAASDVTPQPVPVLVYASAHGVACEPTPVDGGTIRIVAQN